MTAQKVRTGFPCVAAVIRIIEETLVVRQGEDAAFRTDSETVEVVVISPFQHGLPCFAFILRAKDARFAAEQVAIGGHAFQGAWDIDGFPNTLRLKDADATEGND